MQDTCLQNKSGVLRAAPSPNSASVRCSLILPSAAEPSELAAYLDRLTRKSVGCDYEVIIHGQHAASHGRYLLFVRELVDFDIAVLEESIRELEVSGNGLSVSGTGKFVLVERSLYQRVGRLDALLGSAGFPHTAVPTACESAHREQSPECGHRLSACGPDTVIDPDVVIDAPQRVRIGANCVIRKGVVLRPEEGEIVIGDNCVIDHYSVLHGRGGIYIGDWTVIAAHVSFYAEGRRHDSFDIPMAEQVDGDSAIYLMGDNWIGAGAVIRGDVTIGKGTMILPNSTVTESLPMACTAQGSPARLTGKRHQGDWDSRKEERAVSEGMPENVQRHVLKRAALIAQLIEPQDQILDVGCGEGIIAAILREKAARVRGCDYSKDAVQTAMERHPGIEFTCCNSTNLPFADESFDKVVLSDVAEHLMPVQLAKTLGEIHRTLRPRGVLVLATPLTGKGRRATNYAHLYEYSEGQIRTVLGKLFDDVQLVDQDFGLLVARKVHISSGSLATDSQKGACRSHGGKSTS